MPFGARVGCGYVGPFALSAGGKYGSETMVVGGAGNGVLVNVVELISFVSR